MCNICAFLCLCVCYYTHMHAQECSLRGAGPVACFFSAYFCIFLCNSVQFCVCSTLHAYRGAAVCFACVYVYVCMFACFCVFMCVSACAHTRTRRGAASTARALLNICGFSVRVCVFLCLSAYVCAFLCMFRMHAHARRGRVAAKARAHSESRVQVSPLFDADAHAQ